jgi:hypothetical protein
MTSTLGVMNTLSCYWCAAPATGREHVPPKCIFPVAADTAKGTSYREQLVTVPSCDEHNVAKSHDDEYLLCILAMNILNNPVGHQQAVTKVLRALKRAPSLAELVLGKGEGIAVQDTTTGKIDQTLAIKVEDSRITNALEHIARGAHFHHFQHRWTGAVRVFAEFLVVLNSARAHERNSSFQSLRESANALFTAVQKHGSNPDVFYYQVIDDPNDAARRIMRFSFYDGTRALALFDPSAA